MNRQVDVKALVSHILKGDGLDKCRICLGDTSQGQVHLGDTVMLDGDKPVTLSELLEVITGVEVRMDDDMPSTICFACSASAIHAAGFRELVQSANHHWANSLRLLEHLPDHQYAKRSNNILAVLDNNDIYITDKCSDYFTVQELTKPSETPEDGFLYKRSGKRLSCQCPTCKRKFSYPLLLYKHLKESADMIRACYICAKITTQDNLLNHLSDVHNKWPYHCEKCSALFMHSNKFKDHMAKAHTRGGYTCGVCCCSFTSKHALNAHQSVHYPRHCPNCDEPFRNQSCYFFHVKSCCHLDRLNAIKSKVTVTLRNKNNKKVIMGARGGNSKQPCICDYCNKKFAAKKFVAAHIQIVHTKDTHRPCTVCGKVFAAAHMPTHLKSHDKPKYECNLCGIVLKSRLGFMQHLRLHTGERPYTCQYCGESFSGSSRRSEHIRTTHKKSEIVPKHVCKQCPARFRLPHKLRMHIKSVHGIGNSDEAWYECGDCKEKFASCRSLLNHSRKHKTPA